MKTEKQIFVPGQDKPLFWKEQTISGKGGRGLKWPEACRGNSQGNISKARTTLRCLELVKLEKLFYILSTLRRDSLKGHLDLYLQLLVIPHPFGTACRYTATSQVPMGNWKAEILTLFYPLWDREPKPKRRLNPGPRGLSLQFQLKPSFLPITRFPNLIVLSTCTCFPAVWSSSLPAGPWLSSRDHPLSQAMGAMPDASNAWCVFCTPF